jgi:DNA-directed RNA polymerase specialized sigma24 family protein
MPLSKCPGRANWGEGLRHRNHPVAELPKPFREAIVLREINDLSYSEITDVVVAPLGTVVSRFARARSMLRRAWLAEEGLPT